MIVLAALLIAELATAGQRPAAQTPPGNRIVAQDGDIVVVENDAVVRVVRRRPATVRVVFDARERWLLVLADLDSAARPADGHVDWTYRYTGVGGEWPFGAKWEGAATIEEYSTVTPQGTRGLGIATSKGLVQVLHRGDEFRDPGAIAVLTETGGGNGGIASASLGFDEAERWFTQELRRNDGTIRYPAGPGTSATIGIRGGIQGGVGSTSGVQRTQSGAVRVGGRVRPPVKIADVAPVMPEQAARAGVRGIVIVEITIGIDGTVSEARVLRSIPMLDAAALEAVLQWRYEPTFVDGQPVPVVMTVSVPF